VKSTPRGLGRDRQPGSKRECRARRQPPCATRDRAGDKARFRSPLLQRYPPSERTERRYPAILPNEVVRERRSVCGLALAGRSGPLRRRLTRRLSIFRNAAREPPLQGSAPRLFWAHANWAAAMYRIVPGSLSLQRLAPNLSVCCAPAKTFSLSSAIVVASPETHRRSNASPLLPGTRRMLTRRWPPALG